MSDQHVVYCPGCSAICKTLRGLTQHLQHRPRCASRAAPLLFASRQEGSSKHTPTNKRPHDETFVDLEGSQESVDPLWPNMGMDSTLHEGMEGTTLFENAAINALDVKLHEQLSDMALTDSSLLYDIRDDDNFLVSPNETFEYEALPPPTNRPIQRKRI